jgi:hypothetical protein
MSMRSLRPTFLGLPAALAFTLVTLHGAAQSPQQADSFVHKLALIEQHASAPQPSNAARRRTPVTEDEINSWFAYRAQTLLPAGLSEPRLAFRPNGTLTGAATVDLDAIAKQRASGGAFDPFGYIGGRVPLTVTGILHTQNGRGQFELQSAEVSGVPVPRVLLQELVSYYSRTPGHPEGMRLDEPFSLPANIRQIELVQGQAVVVQ